MPTTKNPLRRKLSVPMVAARLGVAADKVLHWIHAGELRACNLATRPHGRPRFGIDIDDLAEFEQRRQVAPDDLAKVTRIRRRSAGDVKTYF